MYLQRAASTLRTFQSLKNSFFYLSTGGVSHRYIDYYATLGITKSASAQDVKLAYFRQAKKFHPDQNPTEDAHHMFELLSEAYEVLSDPSKRRHFDDFGKGADTFGGMSKGPVRGYSAKTYSAEDLYDRIFQEVKNDGKPDFDFGETPSHSEMSVHGHDGSSYMGLNIPFEDAAKGCECIIPIKVRMVCLKCEGTKSEMGYQGNICPYCEGTGE